MKRLVFILFMLSLTVGCERAKVSDFNVYEVDVVGGSFLREDGKTINVNGFKMHQYEVTQKEYTALMGINPSHFVGKNLPVEMVNWYNAVEYANKLSEKKGLTPTYTIDQYGEVIWDKVANGYRLPTEAEFEFATRGGTQTLYFWGDNETNAKNYVWYMANSNNTTHPVGQKQPNPYGLYDIVGNVWEWCWDWYEYPYGSETDNPSGPATGDKRMGRGGGWFDGVFWLYSGSRDSGGPYFTDDNLGFRLVRNVG